MVEPSDHLGGVAQPFPVNTFRCVRPLLGSTGQVKVPRRGGGESVFAEPAIAEPAVTCSAR